MVKPYIDLTQILMEYGAKNKYNIQGI